MEQQSELAKAEVELASIDGQIAALEKRRESLRAFVKLGRELFQAGPTSPVANLPGLPNPYRAQAMPGAPSEPRPSRSLAEIFAAHRAEQAREGSMKARVLELSRGLILTHGPLHTGQLVTMIEAEGQPITGKDKNTTVSVILSRSDEFVSDRSRGWSLAVEKTPGDVAASPGSSAT